MKQYKKICIIGCLILLLLGIFFIKKIIVYPMSKLLQLKPLTPYAEIIHKFGQPRQITIPFYQEGDYIGNRMINMQYIENRNGFYIEYNLTFNSSYQLNSLWVFDSSKDEPFVRIFQIEDIID